MNGLYKAVEQLVWVGQLGFSLLFPLVCCMGGCWWLTTACGVGLWVFVPGTLLGLLVSGYTFAGFIRYWFRQQDREEKRVPAPRRGGFNRH